MVCRRRPWWTPDSPEVILRQADEEWVSGNRKTFEAIKEIADSWEIRDNSVDGKRPRWLIADNMYRRH